MRLYLSSDEHVDFVEPKEILEFSKSFIDNRPVLLVKVDVPLIGQKYGWGNKDISEFYLTNRFEGDRMLLIELNKFPVDVYVLIPLRTKDDDQYSLSDLQNIAWACLYDNKKDAIDHKLR